MSARQSARLERQVGTFPAYERAEHQHLGRLDGVGAGLEPAHIDPWIHDHRVRAGVEVGRDRPRGHDHQLGAAGRQADQPRHHPAGEHVVVQEDDRRPNAPREQQRDRRAHSGADDQVRIEVANQRASR